MVRQSVESSGIPSWSSTALYQDRDALIQEAGLSSFTRVDSHHAPLLLFLLFVNYLVIVLLKNIFSALMT